MRAVGAEIHPASRLGIIPRHPASSSAYICGSLNLDFPSVNLCVSAPPWSKDCSLRIVVKIRDTDSRRIMPSLTEQLVKIIRARPITDDDRDCAARFLLDTVANTLGARNTGPGRMLRGWFAQQGGDGGRQAFLIGGLAHILEMDDLHRASVTHPGCVVVPAALASDCESTVPARPCSTRYSGVTRRWRGSAWRWDRAITKSGIRRRPAARSARPWRQRSCSASTTARPCMPWAMREPRRAASGNSSRPVP